MLNEAREVIDILPGEHTGKCLLGNNGTLLKATSSELPGILKNGDVLYHEGSLQGAYPTFKMS